MRLKDAARIFTSRQLSLVAKGEYSLLESVNNLIFSNSLNSVRDIYSSVYELCEHEYRNEFVYKNVLIDKLLFKVHSPRTSSLLTEFRVGNSIADFVLLNGKSKCFEIKTEFDTLGKIQSQVDDYLKVFDDVNVVLHRKHIEAASTLLPHTVSIYELKPNNTLSSVRKAIPCIDEKLFNLDTLINSLRLPELKHICESLTHEPIKANNMEVYNYCADLLSDFSNSEVQDQFRKTLKITRKNDLVKINSLPSYLLSAVISYKFKKVEMNQLIKLFSNISNTKEGNVFSNIKREAV